MRVVKIWGYFVIIVVALGFSFQNCSPTNFKKVELASASISLSAERPPQIPLSIMCESEKKNEGDVWMSAIEQEREAVSCTLGSGDQYQVYDVSKELKCINGQATPTGQALRLPRALEGVCNLDCGTHKNGELWLTDNGQARELARCKVGTGSQLQVYDLFTEMKCINAVKVATGKVEKRPTTLEGLCNLDCGTHKNGELWLAEGGQSSELAICKIGTGNQLQVYNVFNEMKCTNAVTAATGKIQKTMGALEGQCNVDCGPHKNGELWFVDAGQARESLICNIGTGSQTQVYNLANEMKCSNAIASTTGNVKKTIGALEGQCNLDCGSHLNGQSWWTDLTISTESLQCATSATALSTIRYQNSGEYLCQNALVSPTGSLRKAKIDESACPPMTFNDQDNQATIAFEDIYPTPLDSDYNDFVTNIKVIETYNSIGELTKINLEYAAKSIGGGLPHKLIAIFDGTVRGRDGWVSNQNGFKSEPMFNGIAKINYELFAAGVLTKSSIVPKDSDLVVFERTSLAVSGQMVAKITVTEIDGKLNLLKDRKGVNIKRYRSLLYIPDSQTYSTVKRYDIDISDINPSAYDSVGRPLGFFVPTNWLVVKEGVNIGSAYPDFQKHADFLKSFAQNPNLIEPDISKNWFNNAIMGFVNPN